MLNNGAFLQNRYEIISRIGSGGMADVYRALDHKLNRYVAIKVLKSEFREDKTFLGKFRAEAQAAAGLSHTNIVNVYDVGEEQGISFIVMELVEGITLKEYIAKKGRLSVREATSIALQAAAGLEVAHNNGIVHRDVKPQNILISTDGKAKIADFGIARAATTDTLTASAMGSVHYCAPEQCRGGYCDAKSDIYSMGVTMFEMLTGRLPYDGSSTVEVALKHLQEDIPSMRQFAPDIPESTEKIVLKCLQKSPNRRYANMTELIRDLKESLINPGGDFVKIREMDRKGNTLTFTREELNRIRSGHLPSYDHSLDVGAARGVGGTETPSEDSRMYPFGGTYYQNSGYQDIRHPGDDRDMDDAGPGDFHSSLDFPGEDDPLREDPDERRKKKRTAQQKKRGSRQETDETASGGERLITVVSIVAAVVVALFVLYFAGRALGLFGRNRQETENTTPQETGGNGWQQDVRVTVPRILGKSESEAQQLLRDQNLGYNYQGEVASSQYAKGLVADQSIEPGTVVESNSMISYHISSGSGEVLTVPDLTGKSRSEAEMALRSIGLECRVDNSRYSNSVPEGMVITTNPGSGSVVSVGETVVIYISQGPDTSMVTVPVLTGHYEEDAKTALRNLGLYAYSNQEYSDTVERGMVIAQDVPPDTLVQTGTTVTITVSSGPEDGGDVMIVDTQSRWICTVQLNAPDIYRDGEPVRIDLVQNGETKTVFEGYTSFPYLLIAEGVPGISTGTVYLYILDPATGMVTSTTVYEGLVFAEQKE